MTQSSNAALAHDFTIEGQAAQLLDKLPMAAYACDNDGGIVYFNRRAEQLWGRAPALREPSERYCGSFRLFTPDGAALPHHASPMARALETGQAIEGEEIVIERPDGVRITAIAHASLWQNAAGTRVGAINILIDVEENRQATSNLARVTDELALQLSDIRRLHQMSERLAETLDLAPILEEVLSTSAAIENASRGLVFLFEPEANVLQVRASLNFASDFIAAMGDVRPGEGASGACLQRMRPVIVEDIDGDPLFDGRRELLREAPFRAVHSTPLVTRAGKFIGVLSLYFAQPRRPTDREMHLAALCARHAADCIENAQLYDQLREADRRKDEFLAMLAHELRNPLAPISNSLQILKLADDLSPGIKSMRDIMERQLNQLVRLVDDLLEVSRITRGKIELRKEPVPLASIFASAVDASRPVIDAAGHQLAISVSPDPITLDADPVRMAQVVSNLLNNAARYTEEGGQIWLNARVEENLAVISVKDTGIGIPEALLPRVFDMFAQLDDPKNRARGGLGIGLALAQKLVELHSGVIEAHSEGAGRGSEFLVRLPLAANLSIQASSPKARGDFAKIELPTHRVLVVDDTHAAAYMLGKLLERLGQQVSVAYSALEAIEQIEGGLRPDIIISDVAMPHMDGLEFARKVRGMPELEGALIAALTGYGQDSDRKQSHLAGFHHHLVKPVSLDALRELLASAPIKARG